MNQHHSVDLRSPWVVSVHDLIRRPGELNELSEQIPAPADLGVELTRVAKKSALDISARLESVSEGVLVSGMVHARLVAECSRCLTEFGYEQDFDLQELFYYPGNDADDDALFVVNDHLDLEVPVRDAIVLELPFNPVCTDNCLGLCPECGVRLNDDPEHNHGDGTDPRWDALLNFEQSAD